MREQQRGLDSSILFYRIVNDFVFNYLIGQIDPMLKNPFDKDFKKLRAGVFLKIIAFGLALIAANCFVFMEMRNPNLFEVMGLHRACTDAEIDVAYDV